MELELARMIIHGIPHAAILIEPPHRISAANAAALELLGQTLVGSHFYTALRQPSVIEAAEKSLKDGEPREAHYVVRGQGADRNYLIYVRGIGEKAADGVLLTFEDLSPLASAGEMRRQFVANLSHELRTPLTAMVGFIETLRGPAKDDAKARDRFLGIMEREAGRMTKLVDDLLSLSRVEENERKRPKEPVDLVALVRSVAQNLSPMAERADVELRLHLPNDERIVPADADQLRQVLNNLIENAIKYGGNSKPVDIRLDGPAIHPLLQTEGIVLSVQDYGEGIEGHHIPRLTERFYRVDSHRSREVGGTGLGLAIVKHIVSRHRGRFRITSEVGKGSIFKVILPSA